MLLLFVDVFELLLLLDRPQAADKEEEAAEVSRLVSREDLPQVLPPQEGVFPERAPRLLRLDIVYMAEVNDIMK